MFLADTALRAIAVATGDVWPEHIWRRHTVALGFNDTPGCSNGRCAACTPTPAGLEVQELAALTA